MKSFIERTVASLPWPAALQLWRDWRAKRRPLVLHPYIDAHTPWTMAGRLLTPLGLAAVCLPYGFFFALTAPQLIVPFAAPLLILALLAIWALPEARTAPVKTLEFFFAASFVCLLTWPNYLALHLPGLPWITTVRLTGFPMAFLLLVSLSISPHFRRGVIEAKNGAPIVTILLLIFAVNACVSLPFSRNVGNSLDHLLLLQVNWIGVFLVSLYVFRTPGRVARYTSLLLLLVIPIAVIALVEFEERHVLWAQTVPSFLHSPDADVAMVSVLRGATGLYRSKAMFSHPLTLAEVVSLMTPFAIHWAVGRNPLLMRLGGLLMLPVIYITVRMTDGRLGILAYLVSILVYLLIWGLLRYLRRRNDLLAALIVYAYPFAFGCVMVASLFVHKLHVLIFGGGAQAGSNSARTIQYGMAINALSHNPIGYGASESGRRMGYAVGDFIAIDSYFINIALDFGVIGLIAYVSIFGSAIFSAVKTIFKTADIQDGEVGLLVPLVACLTAFVVLRGVSGSDYTHPVIFAVLGMTVCLIGRARQRSRSTDHLFKSSGRQDRKQPGPAGQVAPAE